MRDHLTMDCLLSEVLRNPGVVASMDERTWDRLVRAARAARLLAILGERIVAAGAGASIPAVAQDQMKSALTVAVHRRQMALWELDRLERALGGHSLKVVLLKGAAYIAQGLPCATARMISDVDVLVPAARIAEVERLLLEKGWAGEPLAAYDDRYYRSWSHEIPPLRYAGSVIELDVHHAIVPPSGRVRPDPELLFAACLPVSGSPFVVLAHEDQVLHACLHLFYDSDCTNRLRDLVDIDALLRQFGTSRGFWDRLIARAEQHGATRMLWHATRYATRLLDTPVPEDLRGRLRSGEPSRAVGLVMDACVGRTLLPPDPDIGYGFAARWASAGMQLRTMWLRFPIGILLRHLFLKPLRGIVDSLRRPAISP
jgi:Uncharacterised nucleotidyltransferase